MAALEKVSVFYSKPVTIRIPRNSDGSELEQAVAEKLGLTLLKFALELPNVEALKKYGTIVAGKTVLNTAPTNELDETFFVECRAAAKRDPPTYILVIDIPGTAPQDDRKRGRAEDEERKEKRRRVDAPQYEMICERAREFDKKLKALRADKGEFLAAHVGDYVWLPVHYLLLGSSRGRFKPVPQDPTFVDVMLRERTKELLAFLRDGKAKGAYLHGPQGVGKSHALYHAVCALRADPHNRVVYIPDCKSWAVDADPFRFILKAVADAFHTDKDVIDGMPSLYQLGYMRKNPTAFMDFIETFLPEYCATHGLQLFAVFDQHNGLTPDQRAQLPFSLPEALPEKWTRSALCVVSASANNEYYLKIAADAKWPQLVFNRGFTDAEVKSWCAANELPSPGDEPALGDVVLWTSSVPYDLSLWREQFEPLRARAKLEAHSAATAPAWADAIEKSVELYKPERLATLNAQHQKFCIERLRDPDDKALARDTYVVMNLGLPMPEAYLLNQQLMFVEGDRVWPTTPLAGATLSRYWEPQATAAIEAKSGPR